MANLYVRSTDGSDADNGSTWALAKATAAGAAAIDAAGDTVYISQVHSETTASAVTLSWAGTLAAPSRILCANDAAEPPTALATGAIIASTGASNLMCHGHFYAYGIDFRAGTGSSPVILGMGASAAGDSAVFESCIFNLSFGTSSSSRIVPNSSSNHQIGSQILWKNCDVKFGAAGQGIQPGNTYFTWQGGSLLSGGTSPTTLFSSIGSYNDKGTVVVVDGVNLVNASAGMNIFAVGSTISDCTIRNCKLPASWSGSLCVGTVSVGQRYKMINCDAGDTNYRLWIEDYCGYIKSETTIIRTGGASDGVTGLSFRMTSGANAEYPVHHLRSHELSDWIDTVGSPVTLTVEIVHDSAGAGSGSKFQDDEVWLEVEYLGTSGFPLGSFINDAKADVLATAANQADSSETWTTTGLTTPVKQALSVTFTPQEKGFYIARVVLAKASKTLYFCPKATMT